LDELKALNNLLDGKPTKKDYRILTQRLEGQGVSGSND